MKADQRTYQGLFLAEGSSDLPLSDLVEALFLDHDATVYLSRPDFGALPGVRKDVRSRVEAGMRLVGGGDVDVIVVHRDADAAGFASRRAEIVDAVRDAKADPAVVPVIPVRMTEAWLLLDEAAIRLVAGNPKGRTPLGLPKLHEIEATADPKELLRQCLLTAAEATGRRREAVAKRFNQHRRQLLERLDRSGPVARLPEPLPQRSGAWWTSGAVISHRCRRRHSPVGPPGLGRLEYLIYGDAPARLTARRAQTVFRITLGRICVAAPKYVTLTL
jgi:Domain of unknown function (DUF4276)